MWKRFILNGCLMYRIGLSFSSLKSSEQIKIDRMIGVYTGQRKYYFNGLDVLPVEDFLDELFQGKIF